MTPATWKRFYADERARMGRRGLEACFDRALDVTLPPRGALIFPHTRLEVTGALVASVARAVVRSRADEVLAIGVLHRPPEGTRRGVHGPGVPGDERRWRDEFSLDAFTELVAIAAEVEGVKAPDIVARYPFLAGQDPEALEGLDELARLAERAPVVATTDPMHHGAGYGAPETERRDARDAGTLVFARAAIEAQLGALARADWPSFRALAREHGSDLRDVGPVLATLLGAPRALDATILALDLVDYAAVLEAASPTWVAGAEIAIVDRAAQRHEASTIAG